MFCQKCGNQIPDGAAFCKRCGIQINHEHSTYKKQRKSKPKIIAIIAICVVIVATAIAVPVLITSCKEKKNLADMLTAHKWTTNYWPDDHFAFKFNNDGSFTASYDGDYHTDWKGNWIIQSDNDIELLKLENIKENYKEKGWSSKEELIYVFTNRIDDTYLDKTKYGGEDESEIISYEQLQNSWYVSEKYLILGHGFYSQSSRIYLPE